MSVRIAAIGRRSVVTHIYARRAARLLVVPAAALVFLANATGGPPRGSIPGPAAGDAAIEAFVAGQLSDAGIPGGSLAIIRAGRISDVRGFGVADPTGRPVTADTPFVIGSVTKPITALAVLQLADEGRVDLDAPVQRYLPDFTLADARAAAMVTVRQLLDQTSGLPTSAGLRPLGLPPTTLEDQVHALGSVSPASSPGSAFAYSNANYLVLGLLVQRVSGESYGAYVGEHVFAALGMRDSFTDLAAARRGGLSDAHRLWFGLADDHQPLWRADLQPAGFVAASAGDLARLAVAELNGGVFEGVRVLSSAAIAASQRGVASMRDGNGGSYGLGWAETRIGDIRVVGHSGSTTDMASVVLLAPDRGLGLVLLLNGQSTIYELLHKPDLIAAAAFEQLAGRQAEGTLALLYPVVDALAALLLGYTAWSLVLLVRRARRGGAVVGRPFGSRILGLAVATWLNGIIPVTLLVRTPDAFGAPWTVLSRIDIGEIILVFAVLRLAAGTLMLGTWIRGRVRVAAARRPSPTSA